MDTQGLSRKVHEARFWDHQAAGAVRPRSGCRLDEPLVQLFPPARLLAWSATLAGRLGGESSAEHDRRQSAELPRQPPQVSCR